MVNRSLLEAVIQPDNMQNYLNNELDDISIVPMHSMFFWHLMDQLIIKWRAYNYQFIFDNICKQSVI